MKKKKHILVALTYRLHTERIFYVSLEEGYIFILLYSVSHILSPLKTQSFRMSKQWNNLYKGIWDVRHVSACPLEVRSVALKSQARAFWLWPGQSIVLYLTVGITLEMIN